MTLGSFLRKVKNKGNNNQRESREMKEIQQKNPFFYEWNSENYWKAIQMRRLVLRYPIGKDYSQDDFYNEKNEIFIGIFDEIWGCLGSISLKKIDFKTLKMRQFAVHPLFQNKGLGSEIVRFAEQWALENKIQTIELHARKTAISFYENLKYDVIGKEFMEVGLIHSKMIKQL
jgi:GNAT superfamily N-acetyltransferase